MAASGRSIAAALGVCALTCLAAVAQSLPQPSPEEPGAFDQLIPPKVEPKLELSARQKADLTEIQREFELKEGEGLGRLKKEAETTYRAYQEAKRASQDKAARRHHARYVELMFEFRKLRDGFEPRIQALLDEKQKVAYGQLKGRLPGYDLHREGILDPGDAATDFSLTPLDGQSKVRLSDFKGRKPVVLVFGSFS